MISQKLTNFKARLSAKGLSSSNIDKIVNAATEDIKVEVDEIVSSAVNQAVEYGLSIGAKEFLAQIRLDYSTGYIQISTDSGTLDFSEPPLPMLPWLLKNANVAKDGSLYKVIPVGADSPSKQEKTAIRDVASGLGAMTSSRAGVENMAEEMARAFNGSAYSNLKPRFEQKQPREPEFRVASSKQDASQKWVKPSKDLDMTGLIVSLNSSISSQIEQACTRIINRYEREVDDGMGYA